MLCHGRRNTAQQSATISNSGEQFAEENIDWLS